MDRTGIRVRDAIPPDAARLARLRHELRAAEDPPTEPRPDFLARCEAWMRQRLEPGRDRWRCWVVEVDGRIRGHLWIQLFPKVPNPREEAESHAYLTNVYVQPDHRDRGLGSALLERAVGWCRARDVDSVILWPTEGSRPLYRRFGWDTSDGLFELSLEGGD